MLPFLDKNRTVSILLSRRGKSPDMEVAPEIEAPDNDVNHHLKAVAEDMMRAIGNKSIIDLTKALQAAFDICDADENEGPHTNADDIDMDNQGE